MWCRLSTSCTLTLLLSQNQVATAAASTSSSTFVVLCALNSEVARLFPHGESDAAAASSASSFGELIPFHVVCSFLINAYSFINVYSLFISFVAINLSHTT